MTRLYFVLLPVVFLAGTVTSQMVWTKSAANPVLPAWHGDINDPSNFRFTYDPFVLYDSTAGVYKMWFAYLAYASQFEPASWSVGYAQSLNGTDWFVYSKNPVLRIGDSGSFDGLAIFTPFVLKVDNEYKMYYTGFNGSLYQTGLAVSQDGIAWQKHSGNPVLAVRPGTFESVGCHDPKVFFDGSRYTLFYSAYNGAKSEICLAVSADGVLWERSGANPVLKRGPAGSWDQNSVTSVACVRIDGRYFFFYGGGPATPIGFATSTNGIEWTKFSGNPVFFASESGWDGYRVEYGSVIREGNKLKFWYSGQSTSGPWQIGYAISDFVTSVSNGNSSIPTQYSLEQAFPNPFNPETEIRFAIPQSGHVTLKVYDSLGKEVASLADGSWPAGSHFVKWNASSVSSGVYFYRMQSGSFSETRRMLLIK